MIADKENAGLNPRCNAVLASKERQGWSILFGAWRREERKMETLQCERFCKGITLEFGQVSVDSHSTMKFAMYNPDQKQDRCDGLLCRLW